MNAKQHGGTRQGSGRKPVPDSHKAIVIAASVPQWIADKLPEKGRSAIVQAALVEYLKISPPTD